MKRLICIFAVAMLFFTAGCGSEAVNQETETDRAKIQFTDDSGFVIEMDEPAQRIISLYSAHTENLFSLGLEQEIIGVYKTDNYPPQVAKKTVYDYRSDPEKVIAAEPDLVLIRPFIERSKPEFVEALRKAKINVVSLYPESFDGFTQYIEKLGLLTGKEEKAQELLAQFENEILSIQTITAKVDKQVGVYFESTENNYRTVTSDAMPALAIKFAGGRNVASDAEGLQEGSSIAAYGAERILEKAVEIDVYVAQVGGMNSGVTAEGIKERPGFHAIKAVQEGRVYTISEKLISSPTFRFSKGVKELARMFYPELIDLAERIR